MKRRNFLFGLIAAPAAVPAVAAAIEPLTSEAMHVSINDGIRDVMSQMKWDFATFNGVTFVANSQDLYVFDENTWEAAGK